MPRKKSATKRAKEEALKHTKEDIHSVAVAREKTLAAAQDPVSESESEPTSSEEEEEEEEDEYGDLITDEVEQGISKVLSKIRSDPKSLLDPNVKFFKDPESDDILVKKQGEKPMFLKDYHRQNLIDGSYKEFDENETVDGVKSFATEQREERNKLLNDINSAFDVEEDEDDEDDGFMKKKEKEEEEQGSTQKLPDPEKDQNAFLSAFLDQKAWIPKKGDKVIDLDQIDRNDEEDFDNAVEDFEKAYNFRYEDANSTEIISYARNQATLRRSNTNSRKRAREKAHEEKRKAEEQKAELLRKKKTAKLNQVVDRFAKIKEAVGDEVSDEVIQKVFGDSLLNEDFDDADWDNKMAEIFNEQYYGTEVEKPTWDDDLMEGMDESTDSEEQVKQDEDEGEDDAVEAPPQKKAKKEILMEKKSLKKEKESLRSKAQEIIEANTIRLQEEVEEEEEERGRKKDEGELKFKYREVSPETFGLSTREILLADDKQLNSFIGIKKFAPYRPKELRLKDKRKYAKKRHLQEWRKETFRNLHVPEGAKEDEIWVPAAGEQKDTKRRHKSK
ncbi:kri1 [Candida margitis]|uniref:kri1 n=1 Tax=Candida margitis TaxID=1775924 RepID=UPI002225BE91|nr:kri1 [Candida margitis]KAI5970385.1 kri1 [Candida margitis]